MLTATTSDQLVRSAIAILGRAGHEAEARAVESLHTPPAPPAETAPAAAAVSVTEAGKLLGMGPKSFRRRIASGLLKVPAGASAEDDLVTLASIERQLATTDLLTKVALFPYFDDGEVDPESLLGQIILAGREETLDE